MAFEIRRVVTGHDADGKPVIVEDGTPPGTVESPNGVAFSELLWHGGERPERFSLEPPPGAIVMRVIRFPPGGEWFRVEHDDPDRPGMHATDTLDLMVVLDGEIELGLDDGEHRLGAGDSVVQRGTLHRWRVVGDRPCTYAVAMIRPDPSAPEPAVPLAPRPASGSTDGPRRLVVGTREDASSYAEVDGPAARVFRPGGPEGAVLTDLWQTGGRVRTADQGGDPDGPWELEPHDRGIAFRQVTRPPGAAPGTRGWHATKSIDVVLVLAGRLALALPDCDPVVLGPGDVVVQNETEHRWDTVGDEPAQMVALMIST